MRKSICIIISTFFIILGAIGVGYYIYSDLGIGKKETAEKVVVPDLDHLVIDSTTDSETRERYKNKILELSEELKSNPNFMSTWLELASWRKEAGDYDGARRIWEYMTLRWPNDRSAYDNLGTLYHFYTPDFAKAERYMRLTIEREDLYAAAYLNLHELYKLSYKEKSHLADDVLLEGLEKMPNHVGLLFTLAQHYVETGERNKARDYFERIIPVAQSVGDTQTIGRVESILPEL